MITIREYRNEDLESVRDVCHKTAHTKTYQKHKDLVTTMYLDYYAIEEPEHVFVAVDETDTPIGYVLCATDYKKFYDIFIPKYASKFKRRFPIDFYNKKSFEPKVLKKYLPQYPAHLHIDILDGYQNQGVGRRLLEALFNKLKEENVPGVCLIAGASNKNACGFYEHMGFKKLGNILNVGIIYGYLV